MSVKHSVTIVTVALMILFSLSLNVQSVYANPVFVSPINISSPKNNAVYPTNEVPFSFAVTNAHHTYTGFFYSLDGNEPRETNQSSILTNLSSGSHILVIYGNSSSEKYGSDHELLDTVYFNTVYSTPWLTFGLIMTISILTFAVLVYLGRRRLINRLKAEKKLSFWLGLLSFLFFTCIGFLPSFWHWSEEYLFPKFPAKLEVSPLLSIIISIPFMCMGLFLMWFGTRKGESFERKIKKILEDNHGKIGERNFG
jgi:hypothetical protein